MKRHGFWFLAGILLLGGCGGGETVPLLSPQGDCDYAPDPRWQMQAGFLGENTIRDMGWPDGGRPILVGENGFIAVNDEPGHWRREDSGINADLRMVIGDGSGGILALGSTAATVRLADGLWHPVADLPFADWYRPVHGAGAYWLPGTNGVLARIDADATLSLVPVPTEESVRTVLAEPDSLFVMGGQGFCQVRVGETWSALDFPITENEYARCLYRLEDGRLLLVVFGQEQKTYVRETDGWVLHPEVSQDRYAYRFAHEDGYFWTLDQGWRRWDVRGEEWTSVSYTSYGTSSAGFGPDGETIMGYGQTLYWVSEGPDGDIQTTVDPAIAPAFNHLFRLLDGTVVAPAEGGIHAILASGSPRVLSLDLVDSNTFLAGASLRDFFLLKESLYHVVEGLEPQIIPFPEEMEYIQSLVVNTDHQIMISSHDQVCAWDGSRWHFVAEESFYQGQSRVTQRQTLVTYFQGQALYLGPDGLIPIPLPSQTIGVGEPEPGLLMFHSRDMERCLYRMGTGIIQELGGDPLPNCDEARAESFVETEDGGLLVTYPTNLVVGITVSGTWAEWQLVAGPWTDEIEDLQVLADGSLAALDAASGRLLIYPAPGN